MWSAIKNDLFEFVQTVQIDTQSTLAKVIETSKVGGGGGGQQGGENSPQQKSSMEKERDEKNEQKIHKLTQSYETYAEDVDKKYEQSFKKFQQNFSLSSHSSDIARILEWETEVSKYYCDLVPDVISAECFWARYYFKLELIQSKILLADEEDEEELTWDDEHDNGGRGGPNDEENEDEDEEEDVKEKEDNLSGNLKSSKNTEFAIKNEEKKLLVTSSPQANPQSRQQIPKQEQETIPTPSEINATQSAPSREFQDNSLENKSQIVSTSQVSLKKEDDHSIIIHNLQTENLFLTNRVTELQNEVSRLKEELKYYHLHYPISLPNSDSSVSSVDEDSHTRHPYSHSQHPQQRLQQNQQEPHPSMYPIESYQKIGEVSGGESDGVVVLSNEIQSDSDLSSLSNIKKSLMNQTPPTRASTTSTSSTTSPPVKEKSKSPLKISKTDDRHGKEKNKGRVVEDEDDEEEGGWDDSGW